jgi:hypothetical protein
LYYLHNKETISQYLTNWLEYGKRMRQQQALNPTPDILKLRRIKARRLAEKSQAMATEEQ